MKYLRLLIVAVLTVQAGYSQKGYVGLYGGVAAYSGDMSSMAYPKNGTKPSAGLSFNYDLTDHFTLRTGYTYAKLAAADRDSRDEGHAIRNLSFETHLHELSLVGQYHLFETSDQVINPYLFGGFAVFRFNPYTYDNENKKVHLQPLSTEGQGLSAYPDRKPYSLTQIALPFGGGVKFGISPGVDIGVEMGMRKLFTEYIDDVSSTYVDWQVLYEERGQKAVDMSFRGDEINHIPTNSLISYPSDGTQRGDPNKDYYYFTGLHLTYKLGSSAGGSGFGKYNSKKGKMGCPVNVY